MIRKHPLLHRVELTSLPLCRLSDNAGKGVWGGDFTRENLVSTASAKWWSTSSKMCGHHIPDRMWREGDFTSVVFFPEAHKLQFNHEENTSETQTEGHATISHTIPGQCSSRLPLSQKLSQTRGDGETWQHVMWGPGLHPITEGRYWWKNW